MDDRLVGVKEAAVMLGESVGWIYRRWPELTDMACKLPGKKHVKFSYNRLQAYIAAQFPDAQPPK